MLTTRRIYDIFDKLAMLSRQSPSRAQPEPLKRVARGVLIALVGALCFPTEAGSTKPKEYVTHKEFALHLLNYNYYQFNCLEKLYTKESNWRPDAKNGSHHGIPQGRSEYLATVDGYKQVQWGLAYIDHRYITPCVALQHWKDKGWH